MAFYNEIDDVLRHHRQIPELIHLVVEYYGPQPAPMLRSHAGKGGVILRLGFTNLLRKTWNNARGQGEQVAPYRFRYPFFPPNPVVTEVLMPLYLRAQVLSNFDSDVSHTPAGFKVERNCRPQKGGAGYEYTLIVCHSDGTERICPTKLLEPLFLHELNLDPDACELFRRSKYKDGYFKSEPMCLAMSTVFHDSVTFVCPCCFTKAPVTQRGTLSVNAKRASHTVHWPLDAQKQSSRSFITDTTNLCFSDHCLGGQVLPKQIRLVATEWTKFRPF